MLAQNTTKAGIKLLKTFKVCSRVPTHDAVGSTALLRPTPRTTTTTTDSRLPLLRHASSVADNNRSRFDSRDEVSRERNRHSQGAQGPGRGNRRQVTPIPDFYRGAVQVDEPGSNGVQADRPQLQRTYSTGQHDQGGKERGQRDARLDRPESHERQMGRPSRQRRASENEKTSPDTNPRIPYPDFLAEELDRISAAESPFKGVKLYPKRFRPDNMSVQDLQNALKEGNDSNAIVAYWTLEQKSQLADIPVDDLFALLVVVRRKTTAPSALLASSIFCELETVRQAKKISGSALVAGMSIFSRTNHVDRLLACLARFRKKQTAFNGHVASFLATGYLKCTPPDVTKASKLVLYLLKALPKASVPSIAAGVFSKIISSSPDLESSLFWHRTALEHYGFPPDPISSKTVTHNVKSDLYNIPRTLFDHHLGIVFAKHGKVDECTALLARYVKLLGEISSDHALRKSDIIAKLRTCQVVAHLKAGQFDKALQLFKSYTSAAPSDAQDILRVEAIPDYVYIDGWAIAEVMLALAEQGRTDEALALLEGTVAYIEQRVMPYFPKRTSVYKHRLAQPYAAAIRISYPHVPNIVKLMTAMRSLGGKILAESMAILGSSMLTRDKALWTQMSDDIPIFKAYTVVYCIFQSLAMGDNIEKLPRVWKEVMERLINDPATTPRVLFHAHKACLIEGEYNYRLLLTTDEFADKKFSDGRTGREWAAEIEKTKSYLEKRLASCGVDVAIMEAEAAYFEEQ